MKSVVHELAYFGYLFYGKVFKIIHKTVAYCKEEQSLAHLLPLCPVTFIKTPLVNKGNYCLC